MKPSPFFLSFYFIAASSITAALAPQTCHPVKRYGFLSSSATIADAMRGLAMAGSPGRSDADGAIPRHLLCDQEGSLFRSGPAERRDLLLRPIQAATAAFMVSAALASGARAAAADGDAFDDLSMPSEEEDAKPQKPMSEDDAMAARIRLKAELKKKTAEPRTFVDSLKGEQQKQKDMNRRSKEEQRAALCEELGRGC